MEIKLPPFIPKIGVERPGKSSPYLKQKNAMQERVEGEASKRTSQTGSLFRKRLLTTTSLSSSSTRYSPPRQRRRPLNLMSTSSNNQNFMNLFMQMWAAKEEMRAQEREDDRKMREEERRERAEERKEFRELILLSLASKKSSD